MKEYKITVATDPEKNNTFCVYTDTLIRAMQVADSLYRCADDDFPIYFIEVGRYEKI